jgi:hypothetical protein
MQPPQSPDKTRVPSQLAGRLCWPALLLIGLAGLAIRLYVGQHEILSYDEWQHIFMASGARLADVFYELRTNSHPALFFVLLRSLLKLGHSTLLYRSISISAGVGSIFLIGLICRKILRSPVLQLLCAAALALSSAAITMSIQVRSYQLAIVMVLLAFLAYLNLIPAPAQPVSLRPYLAFSLASTLGVLSHYSVIFFIAASMATPLLLAAISGDFRKRLLAGLSKKVIGLSILSFALPCAVFAAHIPLMSPQPVQGYLYDFYWQMAPAASEETASAFALRNGTNLFNLFSPVALPGATAFLIAIPLLAAAGLVVLWKASRLKPGLKAAAGAPIAIAAVMILAMLASALLQRYPFGGLMRHQYILAPFLLLSAFVLLDALALVAGPVARRGLTVLVAAAIVANPAYNWRNLIEFRDAMILKNEFSAYSAAFPKARGVYLDGFSVWGYYVHTNDGAREFVRSISGPAQVDEYRIRGGAHDGTIIFYDKSRMYLRFFDQSLYANFAACLRQSGLEELTVFWFSPGGEPLEQAPGELEKEIRADAAAQGVTPAKLVIGKTMVFGGFRLAAGAR